MKTFSEKFDGMFYGMVQWKHLDALWAQVRRSPEGWYVSMVGERPSDEALSVEALLNFVSEMDALLHREHDYEYCGIVYADDAAHPTFIKIYDPHNLGSVCGSGGGRILPRWLLTRLKPTLIERSGPLPASRQRWWQTVFAR